jgi:C_GCAxxG_C_C family probable redox protein
MTSPAETAVKTFDAGFNCAQSVLSVFAKDAGLDEAQAMKIAACFGGGVVRRGEICGAVSGALMALGLLQARPTNVPEDKEANRLLGEEFLQAFEARHHTLLCRDLLGYDISKPAIRQQALEAGVFKSLCPLFVQDAVEIVQALLEPPNTEAGKPG